MIHPCQNCHSRCKALLIQSLLTIFVLAFYQSASCEQPNVILIVTDDQGYGDMSCHGNPWLKTPNLDQLASEGVSFRDFHVDPYCTPTRASLLTGRWNLRTGAWHVIQGRQMMYRSEITVADVFKQSGYSTAMFGKWHLGDSKPYGPRFRGFDHVVCHKAGGVNEIGNPYGNDYFDDVYFRNGKAERMEGYCTDVWFDELLKFIDSNSGQAKSNKRRPFFAYLSTNAMHSPFTVAEKYSEPFAQRGVPKDRSIFYGMIANFDENLGRLLRFIDQRDLSNDTLIIFMGDNGTAAGAAGTYGANNGFNAAMRGWKGTMYDGGHRVACFARWPNKFSAGKTVDNLTAHIDWLPTMIELCQLKKPDKLQLDGHSLAPLLMNNESRWSAHKRTVFLEQQKSKLKEYDAAGSKGQVAVLTEKWRLVNGELYDIQNDPSQRSNVANAHPMVVAELAERHRKWYRGVTQHNGAYSPFVIESDTNESTLLTVRDWCPTKGRVIWLQDQLADDNIVINGFWPIEVKQSGRYELKLSRFPDDHVQSIRATTAKLEVAGQTRIKSITRQEASVTFEVDLKTGQTQLKTWLSDTKTGTERGAYFVRITRMLNE